MLLNGSAINDAPIDGEPAVFGRLKLAAPFDALFIDDRERILTMDVTMTANLVLLDELLSTYTPGGAGPTIVTKLVSEALAINDNSTLIYRLRNVFISQGISVLDALLASKLRFGLTGDSVVTLDLQPLSRYRGALFTDFVPIVEAAIKQYKLDRRFSDIVAVMDQVIGRRDAVRDTVETIDVTSTGRVAFWDVEMTANLNVIDQLISSIINGGGVAVRVASDAIIITDGHTRVMLRARSLLEAILLSEGGFGRSVESNATFSEALDLSDSWLANRLRRVVTTEGVTLIDLLTSSTSGNRIVSASDFLVIGDTTIVSKLRNRFSADTLGLSDAQLRTLQRLATVIDGVSFQDNTLRVAKYDRRFSELLNVLDETIKSIGFAVLYDVRAILRLVTARIDLGAYDPILLGSTESTIRLGAYH